ncbi:hypothetical protein G9A89_016829 [Geosiphon pyriformis]|nr:hypothetical protein G9A89_016829 [Geosiphon pyriformis]
MSGKTETETFPKCKCGLSSIRLQVRKQSSENLGKYFFRCPNFWKDQQEQCGFFLWDDGTWKNKESTSDETDNIPKQVQDNERPEVNELSFYFLRKPKNPAVKNSQVKQDLMNSSVIRDYADFGLVKGGNQCQTLPTPLSSHTNPNNSLSNLGYLTPKSSPGKPKEAKRPRFVVTDDTTEVYNPLLANYSTNELLQILEIRYRELEAVAKAGTQADIEAINKLKKEREEMSREISLLKRENDVLKQEKNLLEKQLKLAEADIQELKRKRTDDETKQVNFNKTKVGDMSEGNIIKNNCCQKTRGAQPRVQRFSILHPGSRSRTSQPYEQPTSQNNCVKCQESNQTVKLLTGKLDTLYELVEKLEKSTGISLNRTEQRNRRIMAAKRRSPNITLSELSFHELQKLAAIATNQAVSLSNLQPSFNKTIFKNTPKEIVPISNDKTEVTSSKTPKVITSHLGYQANQTKSAFPRIPSPRQDSGVVFNIEPQDSFSVPKKTVLESTLENNNQFL